MFGRIRWGVEVCVYRRVVIIVSLRCRPTLYHSGLSHVTRTIDTQDALDIGK